VLALCLFLVPVLIALVGAGIDGAVGGFGADTMKKVGADLAPVSYRLGNAAAETLPLRILEGVEHHTVEMVRHLSTAIALTLKLVTFEQGAWDEMKKTIFPGFTVGAVYLGFLVGALWPLGIALRWLFEGEGSWAHRFAALLIIGSYVTVVVLIVKVGAALPGGKYDIKLKDPVEGESELVETSEVEEMKSTVVDQDGKVLKDTGPRETQKKFAYRETLLERGDKGKAFRMTRVYSTAEVSGGVVTTILPYQGKTVLIEGNGGKYTFRIEGGGELTGKDAELLDKEFNGKKRDEPVAGQLFLPARPIAVGEVWEIDTAALLKRVKLPRHTPDASKAQASGKLLSASKKSGRQYGVIRVDIVLPLKTFKGLDREVEFSAGAKMTLGSTLEGCIDGSAVDFTITNTITLDGSFPLPNQPQSRVTSQARMTMMEKRKAVAK
jgi:hypothetical protein